MASVKGPGLYEFLTEAELQDYFNVLKTELKVHNAGQLKFVTDEDLVSLGMTKPEIRRLRKYFEKYFPQTYLAKVKKKLLSRRDTDPVLLGVGDKGGVVGGGGYGAGGGGGARVPNKHIIPADAIVINKELGVGEFGVVQQGVWTNEEGERVQVAIKCLSTERLQSQPLEFLKEAAIMHTINSEHIVRLYGVVLEANALMLVTELAPLRSLLECLKEPSLRTSFPVPSLCHFSVQICDGMSYLENNRLIHRDLAARNILVFNKNKIKISDFGLSRALRVGKDYYQTNFNVNLKLPIAWCAPECINYLRFTSASDVWAYGVTLWEMFSYGFQPWPALTGHQILEAIDEPNFQRLEQPEACPREYYSVMLQCWQHDPESRPRFAQLLTALPEYKPEQVQAVRGSGECSPQHSQRDWLSYAIGDVITVLDKRPGGNTPEVALYWKGVLNSGKTGLFDPAHTVAYLGPNVPSNRMPFQRGDGKNPYSSRRRLRPDMISGPQGDLKHTGHVGLDGAYFGDVGFLGEKVAEPGTLQKIVAPYKPSCDDTGNSLTRASSDVSDKAPLLKKVRDNGGECGPAWHSGSNWWNSSITGSMMSSTSTLTSTSSVTGNGTWKSKTLGGRGNTSFKSNNTTSSRMSNGTGTAGAGSEDPNHQYTEISDEDEPADLHKAEGKEDGSVAENDTRKSSFDLGPSLMDEVLSALGSASTAHTSPSVDPSVSCPPSLIVHPHGGGVDEPSLSPVDADVNNVRNEIREHLSLARPGKRKQATVKPISASDERTLDSAIAMANELASRSMLALNQGLDGGGWRGDLGGGPPSPPMHSPPSSPASPSHQQSAGRNAGSRFSFKFSGRSSPKLERRHFSEEVASIPDIQESITEQAKEAYDALVGGSSSCARDIPTTTSASWHKHHHRQQQHGWKEAGKDPDAVPLQEIVSNKVPQSPGCYSDTAGGGKGCSVDGFVTLDEGSVQHHLGEGDGMVKTPKEVIQVSGPEQKHQQHSNPLRLLRAGVTVRPKVRGNKHNFSTLGSGGTFDRSQGRPVSTSYRDGGTNSNYCDGNTANQTLPKGFKTSRAVPPAYHKSGSRLPEGGLSSATEEQFSNMSLSVSRDNGSDGSNNPLPLPPRDRTRLSQTYSKPRHQRKHPLIMPGALTNSLLRSLPAGVTSSSTSTSPSGDSKCSDSNNGLSSPGRLVIQHTHNPLLENSSSGSSSLPKMAGLINAGPGARVPCVASKSPASCSPVLDRYGSREDDIDQIDAGEGLMSMMGLTESGNEGSFAMNYSVTDEEDDEGEVSSSSHGMRNSKLPPAKPPRLFSGGGGLDDSFDSQVASEIDALDEVTDSSEQNISSPSSPSSQSSPYTDTHSSLLHSASLAPKSTRASSVSTTTTTTTLRTATNCRITTTTTGGGMLNDSYQTGDHVSCEDLLEFALDKPDARRTAGPQHGENSDECKLIRKILKNQVAGSECVSALDACSWDVHHALKLLRLLLLLPHYQRPSRPPQQEDLATARQTLQAFGWDVARAASYMATTTPSTGGCAVGL